MDIHLRGKLFNIFTIPESVSKKTGELIPSVTRIQILSQDELKGGSVQYELHNIKITNPQDFKDMGGKTISLKVGMMIPKDGSKPFYYTTAGTKPELLPAIR